mmetsp:Transcript_1229/g.3905  ORF Transcript_1229/g.3905 Transcript_1229/m.3905 type:complete len:251 (+) Transcript_1229:235-987(+)
MRSVITTRPGSGCLGLTRSARKAGSEALSARAPQPPARGQTKRWRGGRGRGLGKGPPDGGRRGCSPTVGGVQASGWRLWCRAAARAAAAAASGAKRRVTAGSPPPSSASLRAALQWLAGTAASPRQPSRAAVLLRPRSWLAAARLAAVRRAFCGSPSPTPSTPQHRSAERRRPRRPRRRSRGHGRSRRGQQPYYSRAWPRRAGHTCTAFMAAPRLSAAKLSRRRGGQHDTARACSRTARTCCAPCSRPRW